MPTASATAMGKVKALWHLVSTMTVSNGMGAIRDKVCHDVSMRTRMMLTRWCTRRLPSDWRLS